MVNTYRGHRLEGIGVARLGFHSALSDEVDLVFAGSLGWRARASPIDRSWGTATVAEPAITVMKSRRRIAFLKAWDHANCIDDYSRDLPLAKWVQGSVCKAAISSRRRPLWVISRH